MLSTYAGRPQRLRRFSLLQQGRSREEGVVKPIFGAKSQQIRARSPLAYLHRLAALQVVAQALQMC